MSKLEKFWDRTADGYYDHEERVNLYANKDFNTTLKYLKADDRVLDYGCATGIIANAIADKVNEVHAIDISSRMIEMAKEKARAKQLKNVHYAHATIYDERFGKDYFDVVLAFRVLHVLEDLPGVIRRINDIMKPGGIFISVTSCMGKYAPFAIILKPISKLGILPHIGFLKLEGLQTIISDGGFEILEHETMDDKVPTYCIVARKI